MTLLSVFQLVARGRIEACGHYLWICPTCRWRTGPSPDAASRDRVALDHCLSHVDAPSVLSSEEQLGAEPALTQRSAALTPHDWERQESPNPAALVSQGSFLLRVSRMILVALIALLPITIRPAEGQIAGGNADRDGMSVPTFPVPGGSVSILNAGEGSVSVPLSVPPGVRQLAPALSLEYSSAAGDEGLGAGWSLRLGYPGAVRRSSRFGVPLYTDDDVFTYVGQDLVPVGGGRYKTRIDNFQRIERSDGIWVVTQKDGTRLEYGAPSVIGRGGTYAWHLSRVSDPLGNTILFEYGGPENARRLERISYTLDKNGRRIGQLQEVHLNWELRPDPRNAANYGELIVRDHRLTSIETTSDGARVRTVELCYAGEVCSPTEEPVTRHSLLSAILEIAPDGTEVPARRFVYQERQPGWQPDSKATAFSLPLAFTIHRGYRQVGVADLLVWDTGVRPVDVNGDGFIDLVRGVSVTRATFRDVWLHDGKTGWSKVTDGSWQVPYSFVIESASTTRRVDQGVRIQDVNGDGLPDLLKSSGGTGEIRLNNGRGWNNPGEYLLPEPNDEPNAFMFVRADAEFAEDRGVRLADLNGDGLPDLIKAREGERRRVYLNNGSDGWDAADQGSFELPSDFFFLSDEGPDLYADTGLRLVDVNADGLTDLVKAVCDFCAHVGGRDIREIWLNHGTGWARSAWDFPGHFIELRRNPLIGGVMRWDFGVQMVDINGDGYPDLVVRIAGDPGLVYLNNQSDGFDKVEWDVPVSTVGRVNEVDGSGNILSWYYIDNGARFMDVDGDGLVDIMQGLLAPTQNRVAAHLAEPGMADLLVEYINPLGGSSTFAYGRANGLGLPAGQMPFTRTVAVELTERGGLDPAMVTDYEFQKGLYDWRNRDFRGFQHVIETRSDDTRREREFYVDQGRKGRLLIEVRRDSDDLVYQEHFQDFSGETPDAQGVSRTLLDREELTRFHQDDESESATRISEYFYDRYGNRRFTRQRGYSGSVERSSFTAYAVNESRWIVGLPSAVYRLEGNFRKLLSTEELYYDDLPLHQVSQGLVTKKILRDPRLDNLLLYGSEQGAVGPVEPGSSVIESTFEHDAYGNVTLGRNGRGFATRFSYQENGFLFPYATTRDNPGGVTIETTTLYHRGLGVLLEASDLNGSTTLYSYDGLGRLSSITYPDDPAGDPGVRVTAYHFDSLPVYMEVEERLDNARTRIRREYLDGMGRPKGKVVGASRRWVLSDATRYDSRGRRKLVYEPSFRTRPGFTSFPGLAATSYQYEDDNVSVITHPGGAKSIDVHRADGVDHIDENGEQIFRRFDAFGQLVEVTDAVGTTRYSYDGLGGLTGVVDPRGLVTRTFHDARGLLRGLTDPDGTQSLRNGYKVWNDYDDQGNHTYRWSGSDVWRTRYDALDRQVALYGSRDFDRGFKAESWRHYDRATNGVGRLWVAIGYGPPTTWNVLSYDVRGRVSTETFNFRKLDTSLSNATIAYTYDRAGNVKAVRDPRGRWIEYRRNDLGQLDGSSGGSAIHYNRMWPEGGIRDLDYDAAGRVTAIHYSHNIKDVFSYDGRGRMTSIMGSGPLHVNYRYEPAGNLRSETHLGGLLEETTELHYDYDRLHRLVGSTGNLGSDDVALVYDYDASGNLLSVTGPGAADVTYQYVSGTNRLEWVRFARQPTLPVRYDPNGHLTQLIDEKRDVFSRTYTYDGLGRLRRYDTDDASGTIVYDARGRKIQRTLPGGRKEIYFHTVDGRVLATYETGSNGAEWNTYLMAEGRRLAYVDHDDQFRYIHSDRLGSARAITAYKAPRGGCIDEETGKPVPCPPVFELLWKGDYLPFGAEAHSEGAGDNFRFTGQELEPALGIYDYGARYYDPLLRRFLQADSFLGAPEDPRTLNRYSYALNNPIGYVDPTGNVACPTGDPSCDFTTTAADATATATDIDEDNIPTYWADPIVVEAPRYIFTFSFRAEIGGSLVQNYMRGDALNGQKFSAAIRSIVSLRETLRAQAEKALSDGETMATPGAWERWVMQRKLASLQIQINDRYQSSFVEKFGRIGRTIKAIRMLLELAGGVTNPGGNPSSKDYFNRAPKPGLIDPREPARIP